MAGARQDDPGLAKPANRPANQPANQSAIPPKDKKQQLYKGQSRNTPGPHTSAVRTLNSQNGLRRIALGGAGATVSS